jgi:hypothetical protein
MRIKKYHIVTATRTDKLWQYVEDLIDKGFQPYGEPFIVPPGEESENHQIAQPMVAYAPRPRERVRKSKLPWPANKGKA